MASMMAQRAEMPAADAEYLAQSKSGSLKAIIWVAAGLPTLFVLMRCYTRICLRRVFGVDDSFMVAAVILLIAYAAVLTVAADKGLGRHLEYVAQSPEDAMDVALLSFVSQPLVIMSCALGKTSFALTLIRVAAQHWVMVLLWFMIISMNILHMLISVCVFARCEDPRHLWNPAIPSNCWSAKAFDDLSLFIGSYSAATDFILALLPWVILWNLQMKKREKFGVAVAMSLGILYVVPYPTDRCRIRGPSFISQVCTGILQMQTNQLLSSAGSIAIIKIQYLVANTDAKDITYSLASLLGWAGVENGVILLGACVPTLRPLLKKIFPGSSAKREKPSNDSTELITFTNFNMFAPKARRGHWSTTVETELPQEADDQSERSIFKRAPEESENVEIVHRLSRGACRTQSNDSPHSIKKTMDVDVIYDQP